MICTKSPKCSNTKHKDVDASVFCPSCNKYFCPSCDKALHEVIFTDHRPVTLADTAPNSHLVTGKCDVPGHNNCSFEYFCKDHNVPCCAVCLCVKDDVGKHSKCQTVPLESMESSMQAALAAAIKDLEDAIGKAEGELAKMKGVHDENEKAKDNVVKQIKEDFEAIRKAVDDREEEILKFVEALWEEESSCDKLTAACAEKPEEAKRIAEDAKKAEEHWDAVPLPEAAQHYGLVMDATKKLAQLVRDADEVCERDLKIKYRTSENVGTLVEDIKKFGSVFVKPKFSVSMRKSPNGKYVLEGPSGTIIRKTGYNSTWDCTAIGVDTLPLNTVVSWDVKVISTTQYGQIMVGVAPQDIDVNAINNYCNCGWYFNCYNSNIYSGPPHKYSKNPYGNGKTARTGDVISVVMDTTRGDLSFSVNGVDFGVAYRGIPLDKPLVPALEFYSTGDTVELTLK